MTSPEGSPFRVLVVCTANICRSPAAEALLRASLGDAGGVEVRSAGLHARVGEPVAPGMAGLLEVPLQGFAARQLTAAELQRADLVLTMTRDQRSAVVSMAPTAVRRTFTLQEFADLVVLAVESGAMLPASAEQGLAALVPVVPRFRAMRSVSASDDIEDPYGGDQVDYARALLRIRGAVEAVAAAVAGADLPERADRWGRSA